ncbi:hypothetical protein ACFYNF_33360 [Streptomyces sp. NPDC006641]|uniref:hypothetical protein n=1 Tax=unclassified Streptomyces TaxID=2593676 RepID=UPI0036A8A9B7
MRRRATALAAALGLAVLAVPVNASADERGWHVQLAGRTWQGVGNSGCVSAPANVGSALDWKRGLFSDATLRVYTGASCEAGSQVLTLNRSDQVTLSQNVASFTVLV